MEHEHNHHVEKEINRMYIGLGLLFIIIIGFAGYSLNQIGQINAQLQNNANTAQFDQLNAQILNLSQSVAALQTQLAPKLLTMTYYYDSADSFEQNAVAELNAVLPKIQTQGLTAVPVDVASNLSGIQALGFRSLPTFYISTASVANNQQLLTTLQSNSLWVKNGFALDTYGSATDFKTILGTSCSIPSKVSVTEFVDYASPTSLAGDSALHSVINNATNNSIQFIGGYLYNTQLFANSVNDSVAVYCAANQTGPTQQFKQMLLAASSNTTTGANNTMIESIAGSLGYNMNQFNNCMNSSEAMNNVQQSNNEAYVTYGISGNSTIVTGYPTVIVDCKYVFPAVNATQIKNEICLANPLGCN